VSVWWNEVEATVDAVVFDVSTVESSFIPVELIELTVNVVFYRLPAIKHTNTLNTQSPLNNITLDLEFNHDPSDPPF